MSSPIRVAFGAATHAGLRRRVNEDSYLAEAPLFLVADGMGGHSAGDVASAAVVAEFGKLVGHSSLDIDDMATTLARARARVDALPGGPRPAGTTLSGVAVSEIDGDGYWLAVNIGDSRSYVHSGGHLAQITVDHSMVQELMDSGDIEAARTTARNVITRAIGAGNTAAADFWMIPATRGDRVLVCSDGLSNELPNDLISAILTEETDPRNAAVRLVREAMVNGGKDNITAVVVDALEVACHAARHGDDEENDATTRPRTVQGNFQ